MKSTDWIIMVSCLFLGIGLATLRQKLITPKEDPFVRLVSEFPISEFGFAYTNENTGPVWVTVKITAITNTP